MRARVVGAASSARRRSEWTCAIVVVDGERGDVLAEARGPAAPDRVRALEGAWSALSPVARGLVEALLVDAGEKEAEAFGAGVNVSTASYSQTPPRGVASLPALASGESAPLRAGERLVGHGWRPRGEAATWFLLPGHRLDAESALEAARSLSPLAFRRARELAGA